MTLREHGIEAKQKELRDVRHEHFLARRYSEKKALRKRDKKLREELAQLLKASQLPGPEADMVAHWDPYHADRAAAFFDPEWMFSLTPRQLEYLPSTWRGSIRFFNEDRGKKELMSARPVSSFDIVIGNPPYVRQEELKKMKAFEGLSGLERPLKNALENDYFCYTGVADLYVYFYEKAFDLLAPGGVLCFISSNKYFRAGYGERLRYFLATYGDVRVLIDFGDEPVFTSIAYPSIILVRKTRETRDKNALSSVPKDVKKWQGLVPPEAQVRTLNWEPGPSIEEFPEILGQRGFTLSQRELRPDGWRLESPLKLRVLEKLRLAGPPLGTYVNGRLYRGILTGLNEAFIVDRETRDRLIAEHKSSTEILKPFLRGRDVKRWRVEFADQYLIKIESSENKSHPWSGKSETEAEKIFKKTYPAIYEHFAPLRKKLIERYDQGKYFWELRACSYWQEFEQPKIIVPAISDTVNFAPDSYGFYSNNKTTICVPPSMPIALAAANSQIAFWFAQQTFATKQGGFYDFEPRYSSQIPIPCPPKPVEKIIEKNVAKIQAAKKKDPNAFVGELEAEIDGLVAHLFGLTEDEYRLILDDLALSDPVRVSALNAYRETTRGLLHEEGQTQLEA
jgi:hypothetical protein